MARIVRTVKEMPGRPSACGGCGTCERCCNAERMRAWYAKQSAEKKREIGRRASERKLKRARRIRAMLDVCKAHEGCLYCAESDPVCLDWHHRDPAEKHNDLSTLAGMSASWARIVAELEKCDVVCANCHRKLEAGQPMLPLVFQEV